MKKTTFRHTGEPLLITAWMLVSCLAAAVAAVKGLYVCMSLAILLAIGAAYAAYRYMTRSARTMSAFIRSIRNSDFQSQSISASKDAGIPSGMAAELAKALEHLRRSLQDKESRLQYFQTLVHHLDTAIIVYAPQGDIEWMNNAALRLVGSGAESAGEDSFKLKSPKNIQTLGLFHPRLPEILRSLGEQKLEVLQLRHKDELTQYAISGSEFVLQGRHLTIASMKNIHSALDSQETLAWQKLIRVLTHEIMNSITPIISLTELLGKRITQLEGNSQDKEEIMQMLDTIARRSDSLTRFVSGYREVSHLPQPLLQGVDAAQMAKSIAEFMNAGKDDITVSTPGAKLTILADKGQIEQVLINLVRNARENGANHITISCGATQSGRVFIRVSDNGSGIEPEVQPRIFIPFFTTKPSGSGIGLTLARQIMLQHGGNIDVRSAPGEGSEFTLIFP